MVQPLGIEESMKSSTSVNTIRITLIAATPSPRKMLTCSGRVLNERIAAVARAIIRARCTASPAGPRGGGEVDALLPEPHPREDSAQEQVSLADLVADDSRHPSRYQPEVGGILVDRHARQDGEQPIERDRPTGAPR